VKISILAFDLSDNATGRADLLARLLAPRWEVEVVGPRFGARVWAPVAGGPVVHRALPAAGARYPRFASAWAALAAQADGDLLYASKPRPTSYGAALLARRRRVRPLLLDIDDWEVGFFRRSDAWGTLGRSLNLGNPNGLPWTWLMERLVPRADALTVASASWSAALAARSFPTCATPRPGTRPASTGRRRGPRSAWVQSAW
jgi:hypothetical protein